MAWNRSRTSIEPRPEPQPAATAAEQASRSGRALAKAVDAGKALREQADQERCRQPDEVQVVAFDPLDERGAQALDRIAAGTLTTHDPFVRRPRIP
jgi:hypothetical protein